jgi:hypothetical protein
MVGRLCRPAGECCLDQEAGVAHFQMPRRRPPTDDEPIEITPEQFAAVEKCLQGTQIAISKSMELLYGGLPDWVQEPKRAEIRRAIESLCNARQSPERIAELVELARKGELDEVPGTVPTTDMTDFFKSAQLLADVKQALSLALTDKEAAIEDLVGSNAAFGDSVRSQRRRYSADGNAAKKELAERRRQTWSKIGNPLRQRNPEKPDSWLAQQIADASGDNFQTIRAAIRSLGLQKKK